MPLICKGIYKTSGADTRDFRADTQDLWGKTQDFRWKTVRTIPVVTHNCRGRQTAGRKPKSLRGNGQTLDAAGRHAGLPSRLSGLPVMTQDFRGGSQTLETSGVDSAWTPAQCNMLLSQKSREAYHGRVTVLVLNILSLLAWFYYTLVEQRPQSFQNNTFQCSSKSKAASTLGAKDRSGCWMTLCYNELLNWLLPAKQSHRTTAACHASDGWPLASCYAITTVGNPGRPQRAPPWNCVFSGSRRRSGSRSPTARTQPTSPCPWYRITDLGHNARIMWMNVTWKPFAVYKLSCMLPVYIRHSWKKDTPVG